MPSPVQFFICCWNRPSATVSDSAAASGVKVRSWLPTLRNVMVKLHWPLADSPRSALGRDASVAPSTVAYTSVVVAATALAMPAPC